jgi:DNA-binding CsgD family transcriptional regulator
MTFDVIGAVEACYAGPEDEQAWLSGLLDGAEPKARSHSASTPGAMSRASLRSTITEPSASRRRTCAWAPLPRARTLTGQAASASPEAEAVLDPTGRALDATGEAKGRGARASLGEAVRLMEKARGGLRRAAPDEALRLWQGLVDGTWSLVEHHEADGKRYLLARRNHPGVREPTALTRQERSVLAFAAMGHQNKYIGYLLGISPSSVSVLLHSAQRKLGLASRATLIRTFAAVGDPGREAARAAQAP